MIADDVEESTFWDGRPSGPAPLHITPAMRDGLLSLDEIDLFPNFKGRPCTMKFLPNFFH